ncbi:MAG: four helix bundle protein [Candidatus Marinimicrobia bacterium CG08_land_8_20_14_0_20_45_22]|nr:MAG: four helix bundle protein [Candidatus Marinimicrobia bacterium CG08_land_8_20_14_0_20_45_22]
MANINYSFATLDAWKFARELRKDFSEFAKSLPASEKHQLIDQITRASRSVTANIAEGQGRYHFQENIRFCRQARGSLFELIDHLTVAVDENYINQEKFDEFVGKVLFVVKVLNGYIKFLKDQKLNDKISEPDGPYLTQNHNQSTKADKPNQLNQPNQPNQHNLPNQPIP